MFAPFDMMNTWSGDSKPHDSGKTRSWQELWNKFKFWLMEPIDFPGKLPEKCELQKEYNLNLRERTDSDTPRN